MEVKRRRKSPEAKGANRLMTYMRARGWLCMKVGGGPYTVGWPDWYCYHSVYGQKWIETKAAGGKLRPSQIKRFRLMDKYGCGVWVCEDDRHYRRLFNEPNWRGYIRW